MGRRPAYEGYGEVTLVMNRMLCLATGAVAVVALALVGCGADPTPTTSATSASPSGTPSPTPTLSEGQREAAGAVVEYYRVLNAIGTDYDVDLNDVRNVAAGDLADQLSLDYLHMRGAERIQTGESVIEVLSVSGGELPYTVRGCLDTSAVDIIDADGNSVLAPNMPTRLLKEFVIEEVAGRTLVTGNETVGESC